MQVFHSGTVCGVQRPQREPSWAQPAGHWNENSPHLLLRLPRVAAALGPAPLRWTAAAACSLAAQRVQLENALTSFLPGTPCSLRLGSRLRRGARRCPAARAREGAASGCPGGQGSFSLCGTLQLGPDRAGPRLGSPRALKAWSSLGILWGHPGEGSVLRPGGSQLFLWLRLGTRPVLQARLVAPGSPDPRPLNCAVSTLAVPSSPRGTGLPATLDQCFCTEVLEATRQPGQDGSPGCLPLPSSDCGGATEGLRGATSWASAFPGWRDDGPEGRGTSLGTGPLPSCPEGWPQIPCCRWRGELWLAWWRGGSFPAPRLPGRISALGAASGLAGPGRPPGG